MSEKIKFEVQADADVIYQSKPTQRVLEMVVTAPAALKIGQRIPLNLAIILDKSGSMSGEKLESVKRAALHVLDMLTEIDRVAIVTYDTNVEVISHSIAVTDNNRQELKSSIQSIKCGSTTNLSGGWLSGCEEVAQNLMEKGINRALLLTDGLANHGITDLEELGYHAGQLLQRGISTSTFGVGHGFNEHLLEYMANQGGGRFYFISQAGQIPEIFEQEFKELAAVTARQITIEMRIPEGVSAQVMGNWRNDQHKETINIWLGDLGGNQKREVYIKLLTPPQKENRELLIDTACTAIGEDGKEYRDTASIKFVYAKDADVFSAPIRKVVMERFTMVELAEQTTEALKLERRGEREKASRMIKQSLHAAAPFLEAKTAQEYEALSDQMLSGLDEETRKTSHQTAYIRKQRR